MTAAIIALSVLSLILIILYNAQRRQIKKICRQLAFLKDNKSNMKISFDTPFSEINELTKEINEIIEKSKKIELSTEKSESELKSTITNLSHDIRTPLTSLDGYFQLLSQSETDEEREHYTKIIQERIRSLKDILEELFTYTKLKNTEFELVLENMNVVQIVCNSVFAFYEDFKSKGIEPQIDIYDGILTVNANEEGLKRVFHNIIKNALEHDGDLKEKSFVAISLTKTDNSPDKMVFKCSNRVSVSDGIDVERVFERFYKSDNARTHSSTGLGLSIARELVQRMNGEIRAALTDDIFTVEIELALI